MILNSQKLNLPQPLFFKEGSHFVSDCSCGRNENARQFNLKGLLLNTQTQTATTSPFEKGGERGGFIKKQSMLNRLQLAIQSPLTNAQIFRQLSLVLITGHRPKQIFLFQFL